MCATHSNAWWLQQALPSPSSSLFLPLSVFFRLPHLVFNFCPSPFFSFLTFPLPQFLPQHAARYLPGNVTNLVTSTLMFVSGGVLDRRLHTRSAATNHLISLLPTLLSGYASSFSRDASLIPTAFAASTSSEKRRNEVDEA
jgi:hypothetical protein